MNLLKFSNLFLKLAMPLSAFLKKENVDYKGCDFKFFKTKLGDFSIFTDGKIVIQYDFNKDCLSLFKNLNAIPSIYFDFPIINDLDLIIKKYKNLKPKEEPLNLKSFSLLKILKDNNINLKVGKLLGKGLKEEVYDFEDNKVLKLFLWPKDKLNLISNLKLPSKGFPKIYKLGVLIPINDSIHICFYIAEKMIPIEGELDPDKIKELSKNLNCSFDADDIMQNKNEDYVFINIEKTIVG